MSRVTLSTSHRKLRITLIAVATSSVLLWGGYEWLLSNAQSALTKRLAKRGLSLTYSSDSWSLWGGVTLHDAALRRLSPGNEPLIEISELHVEVLWREVWNTHSATTRWQTDEASLTLHDDKGEISLQHFTTDFELRGDKIDIASLSTSNGPVAFALTGQILTATASGTPSEKKFSLNLKPLRVVLKALGLKPDAGRFTIAGSFNLDLREEIVTWNAKLHGTGKQVEWRGVPMQDAEVSATLSQNELALSPRITFAQGSLTAELTRAGWQQQPLLMSGTLTDSGGRTSEFNGQHQGETNTLTIASLGGNADLLELARNLPMLAAQIPSTVSVKTFPDIAIRDFLWQAGEQPAEWSLAELQLRTPTDVLINVTDTPLTIEQITGEISYQDRKWQFKAMKARLFGAHLALAGSDDGDTLSLNGTLKDSKDRKDEFKGQHKRSTNTLTIARLSGNANLLELARNVPALSGQLPSNVKVTTFPDIVVQNFVWQASKQPPAWSLDSLQLRSPAALVVMVRDHPLNIDRLTGRVSYAQRRWQLDSLRGQLLGGQFTLDARYDGRTLSKATISLQTLRLAKLAPWVGKISAKLDNADLSLNYSGVICNDPTHSTGSGTLVLARAPVIYIPLLDQAYQLFPNLLPREDRRGTGDIQASFSMNKGIATIDPLKARGESLSVTARGTVDLVKRRVAGNARANLRGLIGVVTFPLSHVLTDMEISGPLNDIRVSSQGPVAATQKIVSGTAKVAVGSVKLSSNILREGLSLPFEALGMFGKDKSQP